MIYIIIALSGMLVGLIIAEISWRRSMKHTHHVVPAAIVTNSRKIVQQKQIYLGLLAIFILAQWLVNVVVPAECYTLVVFALVGGDVQKIASKHIRFK